MTTRRSDTTRAAILAAARERFATDGFERATIRAIAADARIDPSMVMRYYGNKEALFAAAADFDLRLPELGDTPAGQIGDTLARHFLHRWEGDETLLALLRAAVTKQAAADRVRTVFATQIGPVAARLAPAPDQAPTRAGLVATQMLGFALCRYVLRLPPVVDLTPDEAAGWLGPTIQRYLTAD
ncbi:TetR/AcrR family transcriptional regulator [Actinoplanes derwentensis]|uniref:Regulatory protein, tetR family n=1 Tax=Actinoplanes derwentensis TaxID=113562 RepID=A0A1H2DAK1_9ACTN|nr:TetR family transcriptional regulator [Actinoplanes derwentensis]GID81743.1 TetR family transcriptional regulator [Actinoplanes derwentensis]SDT79741.1 regulatory protein, tetR family [Actinoplanes derwentensis]